MALLQYITVQLAYLDVLYTVEFSFRSNNFQWRSICVFRISLIGFFGGSILSKARNLSNIL